MLLAYKKGVSALFFPLSPLSAVALRLSPSFCMLFRVPEKQKKKLINKEMNTKYIVLQL
jgi:hypothetical protein